MREHITWDTKKIRDQKNENFEKSSKNLPRDPGKEAVFLKFAAL